MGDHHLHRLQLLILWRDGAHLVGHLIAGHWHILAFNTAEGKLQLRVNHINTLTLLQLILIFSITIIIGARDTSWWLFFKRAHHPPKLEVDFWLPCSKIL